MTRDKEIATIRLIKERPQRMGLLDLYKKVEGDIHEVSDFLRRGEEAGYIKYVDDGPGMRGYVWLGE